MPLAFLLTLLTYLVIVAACIRFNSGLAAGVVNTLTLAIFLFGLLKAIQTRDAAKRPFWIGFLLFFGGSFALYFMGGQGLAMTHISVGDALGDAIYSQMSSTPFEWSQRFQPRAWYWHLSHCFEAAVLGVTGGYLAMKTYSPTTDKEI